MADKGRRTNRQRQTRWHSQILEDTAPDINDLGTTRRHGSQQDQGHGRSGPPKHTPFTNQVLKQQLVILPGIGA